MPSLLSLDPYTGATQAPSWWKIIYQSLWWHCGNLFPPNVTFKGSSLLTQYCSKVTEPRNCSRQLIEVPIMNAMIKWPPVQQQIPTSPYTTFNLHCGLEKRAKLHFSTISHLFKWSWFHIVSNFPWITSNFNKITVAQGEQATVFQSTKLSLWSTFLFVKVHSYFRGMIAFYYTGCYLKVFSQPAKGNFLDFNV